MNVKSIDNQSFGYIIPQTKKVELALIFNRLTKPEWYIDYCNLKEKREKEKKLCGVILNIENGKRLEAVINTPGGLALKMKENIFRSFFRLNPMKFIRSACEKADEISRKYYGNI